MPILRGSRQRNILFKKLHEIKKSLVFVRSPPMIIPFNLELNDQFYRIMLLNRVGNWLYQGQAEPHRLLVHKSGEID